MVTGMLLRLNSNSQIGCHRNRHTTSETYKCDRELERKRRTNVCKCNSADVEDSPHNDDRLGLGGLRSGD